MGLMNIKWRDRQPDIMYQEMEEILEEMYEKNPMILASDHYELWISSKRMFSPEDWKQFRMDIRVDAWYDLEMKLAIKSSAWKTLQRISKEGNKSTADVQALNQLLSQIDKNKDDIIGNKIFVYNFVPLNVNEEQAPNVRILEAVPEQIENAIKRYSNQTKKKSS